MRNPLREVADEEEMRWINEFFFCFFFVFFGFVWTTYMLIYLKPSSRQTADGAATRDATASLDGVELSWAIADSWRTDQGSVRRSDTQGCYEYFFKKKKIQTSEEKGGRKQKNKLYFVDRHTLAREERRVVKQSFAHHDSVGAFKKLKELSVCECVCVCACACVCVCVCALFTSPKNSRDFYR